MQTATQDPLATLQAICELLNLQVGEQFTVLAKGNSIELVPMRSLQSMRGILKGANPTNYRDRRDRF